MARRSSSQSYSGEYGQPEVEQSAETEAPSEEPAKSLSADDVEGFIQTLAAHPLFQGLIDDAVMKIMVEMQGTGTGLLEELRNMIRAEVDARVPAPPPPSESGAEPATEPAAEESHF